MAIPRSECRARVFERNLRERQGSLMWICTVVASSIIGCGGGSGSGRGKVDAAADAENLATAAQSADSQAEEVNCSVPPSACELDGNCGQPCCSTTGWFHQHCGSDGSLQYIECLNGTWSQQTMWDDMACVPPAKDTPPDAGVAIVDTKDASDASRDSPGDVLVDVAQTIDAVCFAGQTPPCTCSTCMGYESYCDRGKWVTLQCEPVPPEPPLRDAAAVDRDAAEAIPDLHANEAAGPVGLDGHGASFD